MLKCPPDLDKVAKLHWKSHAQHCIDNGSLTEVTADSFALVCRVWSILKNTDPHIDSKNSMKFTGITKMYIQLARPFGLLGTKAPTAKPDKSIPDMIAEAMKGADAVEG